MKYSARKRGRISQLLVALLAAEAGVIILLRSGCRPGLETPPELVRGAEKRSRRGEGVASCEAATPP